MMDSQPITCDRVDRDDLDTRYLAGTLDEPLAEAFEAHYFECERCWRLVQGGVEIRAAGRPATEAAKPAARRRPPWLWPAVAIAAALGIWLVSTVPTPGGGDGSTPSDSVVRGDGDGLPVTIRAAAGAVSVSWPGRTDAVSYRIRIYSDLGDLVGERRATDTVTAIADSMLGGAPGTRFVQVEALDRAGAPLVRSRLMPLAADSARR